MRRLTFVMENEKSFESLYRIHSGRVYRFALRLCANREDAEDLAAESFATAFQSWSTFRGEAEARTWLYRIVLNRWRMQRRRKHVQTVGADAIEAVVSTFDFADFDLAFAICQLPEPLREAFLLVKGEGMTHAEAARIGNVPVGTMYFRVHQAVTRLRAELQPQEKRLEPQLEVTCDQEM